MKILSENKKAYFNYQILEKYEAGLVLQGQEVKSIKGGKINLLGSYVAFRQGAPCLVGAKIPAYQPKNAPEDYNPERARKLLLNKSEINYLLGKSRERGISLVPLKVYEKGGRVKLEFGLAKGKKKFDKREKIKKKDIEKEIKKESSV